MGRIDSPLEQRERASVAGLGFGVATLRSKKHGKVVQRRRKLRMIATEHSLLDRERLAIERFCLRRLAPSFENRGKVVQVDGDLVVLVAVGASKHIERAA